MDSPRLQHLQDCLARSLSVCLFAVVLLLNPAAWAQSSDSVHVTPNAQRIEQNRQAGDNDLRLRTKPLRVDVDLVLVPVTVTDPLNRPVLGLTKDDFQLLDGGREQQIRFFSSEDAPLSVGLILDVSNSMAKRISTEREALAEFFKYADPQDEYFAIAVSDRPEVLADSTQTLGDIQSKLAAVRPAGYTALIDTIYFALNKIQSARYRRRVLLIISDGGENDSHYKLGEIKGLLAESDVPVYAIRPVDALPFFRTIEERLGNRLLSEITELTGGRTISLANSDNVPAAAAAISMELRNQYVLGYHPTEDSHDGRWHKIKVRIIKSHNSPPLQAHYKKGYAAPVH
jgi:Ca-activated chloride channel family protein